MTYSEHRKSEMPRSAEAAGRRPAQIRMAQILDRLREGGSISVTEIAAEFGVSDMTVRRDLTELEKGGLLERVHGGAIGLTRGPLALIDDVEPQFEARLRHNAERKARIAATAAQHVADRQSLAFDLGTTVLNTASALVAKGVAPQMRVFTNSLRVGQVTARAGLPTYMCGGTVNPEEMSLTGTTAVETFSRYYFDAALFSASGLTEAGLFDYSPEEAAVKSVYLSRAAEKILLMDSSKFRRLSTVLVAGLAEISTLITDAAPPPDLANALQAAGVRILLA